MKHKISVMALRCSISPVRSWQVRVKKHVLKDGVQAKDQALLLLYSNPYSAIWLERPRLLGRVLKIPEVQECHNQGASKHRFL